MKSIRPIQPTAASMPAKSVAPMKSKAPRAPLSQAPVRGITSAPLRGLPQIGDQKRKASPDDSGVRSLRSEATPPYAFLSLFSYMPTSGIALSGKKFDSSYLSRFKGYSDFITALSSDFGPGSKKTYQTTSGPQDLYAYQYDNLLKYGDIRGAASRNQFVFRDGYWWSVRQPRYDYAELSDSVLSPAMRKYALSADESSMLYGIAQRYNLTSSQYGSLYKTVVGQKFFRGAVSDIPSLVAVFDSGKPAPGISTTAQYGSVFGSDNQFKGYVDTFSSLAKYVGQLQATLQGDPVGAGVGAGLDAGGFGESVLGSVQMGLDFLKPVFASLWGSGDEKRAGLLKNLFSGSGNYLDIVTASYSLWANLFNIAGAILKKPKSHRNYNLINANGKIIDKFSDITDRGDADGIGYITNRAVENGVNVSYDDVAGMLGAMYRYRAAQQLQYILADYATMVSPRGYLSGVMTPTF